MTISRHEDSVLNNWGFQMSSRLRTAALFALIAVAAVSASPKMDLPETAFDETDTPTIQTIFADQVSFSTMHSVKGASALMAFARMPKARVRSISPAYTAQSSESRRFRATLYPPLLKGSTQ